MTWMNENLHTCACLYKMFYRYQHFDISMCCARVINVYVEFYGLSQSTMMAVMPSPTDL